jgi:hypothetical protein
MRWLTGRQAKTSNHSDTAKSRLRIGQCYVKLIENVPHFHGIALELRRAGLR